LYRGGRGVQRRGTTNPDPLIDFGVNPSFRFDHQKPLFPMGTLAPLPGDRTLIAKLGTAQASDMKTPVRQFNHAMTFWTPLPPVLFQKRLDGSGSFL
jgi:hypothetical protein